MSSNKYFLNGEEITVVDSRTHDVPSNIKTGYLPDGQWVIIKDRKSRIIMKDGEIIREQAKIVLDAVGAEGMNLVTNAPACSKTKVFLEELNINVFVLDKPLMQYLLWILFAGIG